MQLVLRSNRNPLKNQQSKPLILQKSKKGGLNGQKKETGDKTISAQKPFV